MLVCAAALLAFLTLLWYLRVIVLPIMVALTIAPALTPVAARLRRLRLERAAPALALLAGIARCTSAGSGGSLGFLVALEDHVPGGPPTERPDHHDQAEDDVPDREDRVLGDRKAAIASVGA